jgi:hypothetical protein
MSQRKDIRDLEIPQITEVSKPWENPLSGPNKFISGCGKKVPEASRK